MEKHCWRSCFCNSKSYVTSSGNLLIKCMTSSAYQLKLIYIGMLWLRQNGMHYMNGSQVCAVITFAVCINENYFRSYFCWFDHLKPHKQCAVQVVMHIFP